jgi:hypothetical protein
MGLPLAAHLAPSQRLGQLAEYLQVTATGSRYGNRTIQQMEEGTV